MPGAAWRAAGPEHRGRGTRREGRDGAALRSASHVPLRAEELFLSRLAEGLSNFAIRSAAGRGRLRGYRGRRQAEAHRCHARAHGRRRRQEHPRRVQGLQPLLLRGPQPQRNAAHRNRERARYAQRR